MIEKSILLILAMIFVSIMSIGQTLAAGLENFQFLKISPPEQKAVMKTPDGALQLVGVGDVIAGDAKVVEIAEGRVVLEQSGEDGTETVIVRLDGKHQRIERIRPQGEKPPVMTVPVEEKDSGERGKPGFR